MEHILVSELHQYEGKEISGFYLASEKDLREGKGGPYLRLRLLDLSGQVAGNVWKDAANMASQFNAGDVIHLKANVVSFKGQIQLSVTELRFADKSEFDIALFMARSRFAPELLAERFWGYVDKVDNEYLNRLLHLIFDNKDFFKTYLEAPAAKGWHHNYMHGLIEHSVAVASLCEFCSLLYPISFDLTVAGALLHDVAKVWEYSGQGAYEFTDRGRLIGHLSMSDELVLTKAKEIPGFPEDLLLNLRHLILSHHGEYEKASVRLPQTLEAIVLHHCDNLDAHSAGVSQLVTAAPPEAVWSEFDKLNNRYYRLVRL
jgi:3'-5' exoribonuclease